MLMIPPSLPPWNEEYLSVVLSTYAAIPPVRSLHLHSFYIAQIDQHPITIIYDTTYER